ncbi:MAG TPA: tetratricopeptide repeat protein [Blastocatellia bacterium]|nr:tetratricopeptide repeat protein [Blastocatellia bacterium]
MQKAAKKTTAAKPAAKADKKKAAKAATARKAIPARKPAGKAAAAARPKKTTAAAKPRAVAAGRRPATPPAPPQSKRAANAQVALRAYERALKEFNRQDFAAAKAAFEEFLAKFGDQEDIAAGARTYLAVCEQRLARTPTAPRSVDDLYDRGVIEFNRGNAQEAIALFDKALKAEPRADHVWYSLAAAYTRADDAANALFALRRAIALRPIHRSRARNDLDFTSLHANEEFRQLTGFGFELTEE